MPRPAQLLGSRHRGGVAFNCLDDRSLQLQGHRDDVRCARCSVNRGRISRAARGVASRVGLLPRCRRSQPDHLDALTYRLGRATGLGLRRHDPRAGRLAADGGLRHQPRHLPQRCADRIAGQHRRAHSDLIVQTRGLTCRMNSPDSAAVLIKIFRSVIGPRSQRPEAPDRESCRSGRSVYSGP